MEKRSGIETKNVWIEASSIVIFGLAVFTLFAILTYHPSDPTFLGGAHAAARNACGVVGASVAALLLEFFGLGAFLFPAALLFTASVVHRREGGLKILMTLSGMTVAVLALGVFLSVQWKYWAYSGTLLMTGGAVGAWFASLAQTQLNPLGTSLAALAVFALAVALSTPLQVARSGAWVLNGVWRFLSRTCVRAIRVAVSYAVYLGGLVVMRVGHALGDGAQRAAERTMQAMRERRENQKLAMARTVGVEVAEGAEGVELESAPVREVLELTSEAPSVPSQAASSRAPAILPRESDESVAKSKTRSASLPTGSTHRGQWKLPTIEFLKKVPKVESSIDRERLIANSKILQQKFADFGIEGEVTAVRPGPVITLYEFKPGPGVKVSRIAALADDLSMALSAQSVRILAPLPGKAVVGIEIPSEQRETVYLREFLQNNDFLNPKHTIPVVMGKDIGGLPILSDLARMPHLLCAGQTGAGKSVFMNGLICSLFYRFTPDELRMILIDPKFIEFRAYQDIPHLLLPVVDDPKQASTALRWAVREMERRYRILAKLGARNLASFNQKVQEMGADVVRDLLFSEENQETSSSSLGSDWIEAFEPDESGAPRVGKLPYIVIIIDELADLMMIAKKEVEISIARIAQKARAAGLHLVIATQRPSVDVITGLIKANLPSRVSFQLASYTDSKTILDRAGAERLLGQGDMLFIPPGVSQVLRLHGAFVDDDEIHKVTAFLKSQGKPAYRDEILLADEDDDDLDGEGGEEDDALFEDAMELVRESGHASASFLQRRLKVGYNRAARMIERMEAKGFVGPADGARPREVLMR